MARFSSLFLFSTFVGGIVTGLAGFAMGLVVSGIWLHILTPLQTAALIVGYGLLVQSYSIWKLRHALNWRAVAPVHRRRRGRRAARRPAALAHRPGYLRTGVGVLLVVYSSYFLAAADRSNGQGEPHGRRRRRLRQRHSGRDDRACRARSSPSGASCAAGQGRAARDFPAGHPRGLRPDRHIAGVRRRGHRRDGQALSATGCRLWAPAFGSGSSFTAISTTPPSAR